MATKTNAYTRLLKSKSSFCKGRGTKAGLNKAKAAYIKKAVGKGKTKSEATKIANKVVNGTCGARINGKKRSKSSKSKSKK